MRMEKLKVSSVLGTRMRRVILDHGEMAPIMTWGVDPHFT
jgi:hypothetical protein